jgi:hypothetical protein
VIEKKFQKLLGGILEYCTLCAVRMDRCTSTKYIRALRTAFWGIGRVEMADLQTHIAQSHYRPARALRVAKRTGGDSIGLLGCESICANLCQSEPCGRTSYLTHPRPLGCAWPPANLLHEPRIISCSRPIRPQALPLRMDTSGKLGTSYLFYGSWRGQGPTTRDAGVFNVEVSTRPFEMVVDGRGMATMEWITCAAGQRLVLKPAHEALLLNHCDAKEKQRLVFMLPLLKQLISLISHGAQEAIPVPSKPK